MKGAIPGCQVLVAKNNQIVFNKSYGTIAGAQSPLVTNATLYDLASMTKTSATTVAIMKLVEEGKVDIEKTINSKSKILAGYYQQEQVYQDVADEVINIYT